MLSIVLELNMAPPKFLFLWKLPEGVNHQQKRRFSCHAELELVIENCQGTPLTTDPAILSDEADSEAVPHVAEENHTDHKEAVLMLEEILHHHATKAFRRK